MIRMLGLRRKNPMVNGAAKRASMDLSRKLSDLGRSDRHGVRDYGV